MKKIALNLLLLFTVIGIQKTIAQDYNILSYGAVSDTTKLSTTAINKAIDACTQKGGGRVVVPAGNYKSGTITLKSNVELYLERGATIYTSTNLQDLPKQKQPAYQSQKDLGGWYALIYAEGANNIGISGKGTIDGQGENQMPRPNMPHGDLDGRPRNILFISCKNISVSGITMLNAGIWNQHYLNCEDVMVNNITVYNHSNRNNDGIDIDGCRRFVLSNSIIDSDDDAIVLKSTGPAGCEDVTITNCITSSFTNAIKCGTESTGGFKNIAISNCVVKKSKSTKPSVFGFNGNCITAISLEIVDGGTMDGVIIDNIVIEGTEAPIYVRLGNRARKYNPAAREPAFGTMRNISISNITAYNTGNFSSSITGVPGSKIENISLHNIRLVNTGGLEKEKYLASADSVKEDEKGYPQPTTWGPLPSYGFFIRHVKNIALSDVSLGSTGKEDRAPIIGIDIDKLRLYHLTIDGMDNKIDLPLTGVRKFEVDDNVKVISSK